MIMMIMILQERINSRRRTNDRLVSLLGLPHFSKVIIMIIMSLYDENDDFGKKEYDDGYYPPLLSAPGLNRQQKIIFSAFYDQNISPVDPENIFFQHLVLGFRAAQSFPNGDKNSKQ